MVVDEYRIKAIESLLIKKGIITEKEIKEESDRLLKKKWEEDKEDIMNRGMY